ncbi:hypothetical protein GCM10010266_65160 [Streptomyces griseomycini]|nr:hypothetical protein GCM10010266_65160 [Streptomyces griseomycini]
MVEVDEFTAVAQSGWNVIVTVRASVVADAAEHERLSWTGSHSWMPVRDGGFVRIGSEPVAGREITGVRTTR